MLEASFEADEKKSAVFRETRALGSHDEGPGFESRYDRTFKLVSLMLYPLKPIPIIHSASGSYSLSRSNISGFRHQRMRSPLTKKKEKARHLQPRLLSVDFACISHINYLLQHLKILEKNEPRTIPVVKHEEEKPEVFDPERVMKPLAKRRSKC